MAALWIFLSVLMVLVCTGAIFIFEVWMLDGLVEAVNGEYPDNVRFPLTVTLIFLIVAFACGISLVQWVNQWILTVI